MLLEALFSYVPSSCIFLSETDVLNGTYAPFLSLWLFDDSGLLPLGILATSFLFWLF
jgi:hypothetical protein